MGSSSDPTFDYWCAANDLDYWLRVNMPVVLVVSSPETREGYWISISIVLSYAYWHTHFHDDRGVLGRVVQLNQHPFTIIGVAPPAFRGTVVFPLLNSLCQFDRQDPQTAIRSGIIEVE
jgi:hypothetical protein